MVKSVDMIPINTAPVPTDIGDVPPLTSKVHSSITIDDKLIQEFKSKVSCVCAKDEFVYILVYIRHLESNKNVDTNFINALNAIRKHLENDISKRESKINADEDGRIDYEKIYHSSAYKTLTGTLEMLSKIINPKLDNPQKVSAINFYKATYSSLNKRNVIIRSVCTLAAAAIGFVVGGGFGFLVGGLVGGAIGASVGVAFVTPPSAYGFFRPWGVRRDVNELANAALQVCRPS